ncbi:MAG: hypothetical protein NXI27_11475 [Alphaproteobacteria bacterium]|nr:hypothetical protein [Alphaproteobacteria bacterium]
MSSYNYDSFSSEDYDFDHSTGPAVGEKAPDFLLTTSAGDKRNLLDFDGEILVLEMGSITCPLFQGRRKTMETLDVDDKRVSQAVLYVREAHPGADIPQHRDLDAKRQCARRLEEEDGETRLILVDDIEGTAHNAYGAMPNTVFIINRNGCVVFRAEWNNASATKAAVIALLNGQSYRAKSFFRPGPPAVSIRTLRRAGKGSVSDFLRSFPILFLNNIIKRNMRLLFNRPTDLSRNTTC